MNDILQKELTYHFTINIEVYHTNPFFSDEIKNKVVAMIDTFGWNLNDFKEKLLENANKIATDIIQEKFNKEVQKLTTTMTSDIIQKIP
jgi:hypothetical protein